MQPSSMDAGPVQEVSSVTSCLTNESEEQQQKQHFPQQYDQTAQQHIQPSMDDFMEQMFMMQPWDFNASSQPQNMNVNCQQKLFTMPLLPQQQEADNVGNLQFAYEDPTVLAARLRQHQLNGTVVSAPHSLPLSLGQGKPGDINGARPHEEIMANNARDPNLGGLFSPFAGTARGLLRPPVPAPSAGFQTKVQVQAYGGMPQPQHPNPSPPVTAGAAPSARPRVRARRGQATDPHSIAERLRRERIAERMKALQELVPNSNKTDKASMLDEIIEYVKFLQLQVKVLSMSRLGGAGAVAPLVADMPSEGANTRSNGSQNSCADGLSLTEKQVAKLMEEDMGSAMQYLQGKGLCLMPISLATAISSTTRKQQQQQQPQSTHLQGLLASNGIMDNQRRQQQQQQQQLVEPANSSLSAITTISSSTEAGNSLRTTTANNNGSSSCKDGRTANSVTNANGIKTDEESQSRRTGLGL